MKLRIKDNSIRIRLNQTEVTELSGGAVLRSKTVFSPVSQFQYSLVPWELDVFNAHVEGDELTVNMPIEKIQRWLESDETGFEFAQKNGETVPLTIIVEKDFACLNPRDNEADNFPNPEEGKMIC